MKTITLTTIIVMALFSSCYFPKKIYIDEVNDLKSEPITEKGAFTFEDIKRLPEPVQRYLHHCGYIGKPIANHAEVCFLESYIKLSPDKKWLKLRTYQHNFTDNPSRLAYMRANMFGFIPFEGRDKYHNGHGHMYGILGKMIKIFDETDVEIAQGAAIVLLAEVLLIPSYAIQPYIHWEAVDEHTANARFVHQGVDVGGTFHFNEQGDYIRFTSNERPYSLPKGGYELQPYTIEIRSYQQQGDIRVVKEVAAIWNMPQGDFEYWRGTIREIK